MHAVCDEKSRPVILYLSEGQVSDYNGAKAIIERLPLSKHLLADRGYDADWLRYALRSKGIEPCIPPRQNRKTFIKHDNQLYKKRHTAQNMFAKFKDWRRIATRYDRQAHTFFSAICIAAIVIWWI